VGPLNGLSMLELIGTADRRELKGVRFILAAGIVIRKSKAVEKSATEGGGMLKLQEENSEAKDDLYLQHLPVTAH
jgi:hypothetical protein